MNSNNISIDELNPYIRRVGKQGLASWENKYRKIYDYEWMYCISGKSYYKTLYKSYQLSAGDLLLIKPNMPHEFWVDQKTYSEIIWIHFDFNYRKDVYDLEHLLKNDQSQYFKDELPKKEYLREEYIIENRFKIPTVLNVVNKNFIETMFKEILDNYSNHYVTWHLAAKANLLLIIKSVIEQLSNEAQNINYNVKLSQQIHEYLNQYYFRKITRREIANYFGYSQDYVGKLFKHNYKLSISGYTNQLRVAKAKELLVDSDLTIENISELIGFSDVSYFSNTMKKLTGYSPNLWRKTFKR